MKRRTHSVPDRYASIDIGTNSTLLLVAEYDGHRIHSVYDAVETTRIGQNVSTTGQLHPDATARTMEILRQYHQICRQYNVNRVILGGTSALRDATNGQEFIEKVEKSLGWQIRVLTGQDEARLIYLATRMEFQDLSGSVLVVDIGGGSTEFIAGSSEEHTFLKSLDIGTVRFTERFITSDPPTPIEIENARAAIRSGLDGELTDLNISGKYVLIGVAGTVTTLLAVEKSLVVYDPDQIHAEPLTCQQIHTLLINFCSKTLEERRQVLGLQPERADVIIMGTLILQEILRHFSQTRMLVNDRGVRYGLLYDLLQ